MLKRGWVVLWLVIGVIVSAQAQNADVLQPFTNVFGTLAAGEVNTWTFRAVEGEVVSLVAQRTDGSLDPILQVTSSSGAVVAAQDDVDYPLTTDAVIQALTIPFAGEYTITVSGYQNTSGSYQLTRLRGYATTQNRGGFGQQQTWGRSNDDLVRDIRANAVDLSLEGTEAVGVLYPTDGERLTDYYAHVQVEVTEFREGWSVVWTHRQQTANRYYAVSVRDDGRWRLVRQDEGQAEILRDWNTHPSIIAGETTFDIGVLAQGASLEVFYNGSLIGAVQDNTYADGVMGFGLMTAPAINAQTAATFSTLRLTVPRTNADGGLILPEQLALSGTPEATARLLTRYGLIPADGAIRLNPTDVQGELANAGVSRVPLGRGLALTNFVMATQATANTDDGGVAGCGLFFRAEADDSYILAYADTVGGYGLSVRAGDTFTENLFALRPSTDDTSVSLLAIAVDDAVHLYIDGSYSGTLNHPTMTGTFGNAVVSYAPQFTVCTFTDTWVWSWDATQP
jgi:hypothetical protein